MTVTIWLIVSVGFVIQGLVHIIRTKKLLNQSDLIKGKIVDFKKQTVAARTGIVSYIPIIEFIDQKDGFKKELEPNSGFPKGKYSIGDTIEVWYYSTGDEPELIINNWSSKWAGVIFSTIGGFSLIIGGWIL